MPSYEDPYGDFDHIKPVPMEEAVKLYQVAEAKLQHLHSAKNLWFKFLSTQNGNVETKLPASSDPTSFPGFLRIKLEEANKEAQEATIRLTRSARAHQLKEQK